MSYDGNKKALTGFFERDSAWKSPTESKLEFSPWTLETKRTEPPYCLNNSDSRQNPYLKISVPLYCVQTSYPHPFVLRVTGSGYFELYTNFNDRT